MPEIKITIRDKVAIANGVVYICGNSDYTIAFDFDPEWDAYETKTARFVYGEKYTDVVFSGNTCQVPVLTNLYGFKVGVFAGDLHTTTPAKVYAKKSILCSGGSPEDPPEDVYNQIMEKLNSGSSGGGGADWNASEGEPGHILHRPFYKEPVELLPLSTGTPAEDSEGVFLFGSALTFTPGETYYVNYNGVDYTCVAFDFDGATFIGNKGYITEEETDNTGEPFFMSSGDVPFCVDFMGATEATVRITGEKVVPIPREYLPPMSYVVDVADGVGKSNPAVGGSNSVILDFDHDGPYDTTELYEALKNGYPIYLDITAMNNGAESRLLVTSWHTVAYTLDELVAGGRLSNLPVLLYAHEFTATTDRMWIAMIN